MGGWNGRPIPSVEVFPPPSADTCSPPDLPEGREGHSISLLSGVKLVVCGGSPFSVSNSCIMWISGTISWTHMHSMRSSYYILTLIRNSFNRKSRASHVAWTPPSPSDSIVLLGGQERAAHLTAEIVPGFEKRSSFRFFLTGGETFELRHSGREACGIPDGDGGQLRPHVCNITFF